MYLRLLFGFERTIVEVRSYREEGSLSPFKAQRGREGGETCISLLAVRAGCWLIDD
jgi:hypothetical protein